MGPKVPTKKFFTLPNDNACQTSSDLLPRPSSYPAGETQAWFPNQRKGLQIFWGKGGWCCFRDLTAPGTTREQDGGAWAVSLPWMSALRALLDPAQSCLLPGTHIMVENMFVVNPQVISSQNIWVGASAPSCPNERYSMLKWEVQERSPGTWFEHQANANLLVTWQVTCLLQTLCFRSVK